VIRSTWQFADKETLGMTAIYEPESCWHGFTPVPRMIQNQLGHLVEMHMAALDEKILFSLRKMGNKNDRREWMIQIIAIAILLHTREVDIGRNIYWSRRDNTVWSHL
jgi:hypothetical protein